MMFDRRTLLAGLACAPLLSSAACAATQQGVVSAAVHKRRIPGANRDVTQIGIGTARRYQGASTPEQLAELRGSISRFAELGGTLIDTAPSYGNAEEIVGRLVAEQGLRPRLFLATKVAGKTAAEGQQQIDTSFRNLRTDTIDLINLHNMDDVAGKLAILRDLQRQGRVRAIGASISSPAGFAKDSDAIVDAPDRYARFEAMLRSEKLDVIQVDYAIDNRAAAERILPLAQEQGLAVMVNLPFGRGRLFEATKGKPLPDWAATLGVATWAQFFLKYIISHPARPIAIPGMAQVKYIDDNLAAARGPLPDAAMRKRMEALVDGF